MRAGPSWVTFPGVTHASMEYSPLAWRRSASLRLAPTEPWARPELIRTPQPPTHS